LAPRPARAHRGRGGAVRELEGRIQHYPWGSNEALPGFLDRDPDGRPWAEVWFGAHPLAPARLAGEGDLDQVIAADPRRLLGADVARAFDSRLPFLLKVIAAERPLSLQVHPSREHAAESYAAENAAGLELDSPRRNYRDANHKPELLVAMTPFSALCGFRTPRRAAAILEGLETVLTARLHALRVGPPSAAVPCAPLRPLVPRPLHPDPAPFAGVVAARQERAEAGRPPSPRIHRFVGLLAEHLPGDPGGVAALLLNPVTLQPGEGMYIP